MVRKLRFEANKLAFEDIKYTFSVTDFYARGKKSDKCIESQVQILVWRLKAIITKQ